MRLPRGLLRHTVELAEHLGADATGPLHGDYTGRAAYVEDETRASTDTEGRVTSAATKVWLQLDRAITPLWRCRVEGQTREVVAVAHLESRAGTPDHTLLTVR